MDLVAAALASAAAIGRALRCHMIGCGWDKPGDDHLFRMDAPVTAARGLARKNCGEQVTRFRNLNSCLPSCLKWLHVFEIILGNMLLNLTRVNFAGATQD
jgi:hypothetical protein